MKIQKTKLERFRGYIFSRRINENLIPQRVQNLVIREFANKRNIFFHLSAVEFKMNDCFDVLNSCLKKIDHIDGLIFYSLFMLPKNKQARKKIYEKILFKKKKIYFALEELKIHNKKDIILIESLLNIKKFTKTD